MKISVIIPVYNESKNLPIFFDSFYSFIKANKYDYELIAVDDCSKDNSFSVLRQYAEKDEKIKAIRFRRNRGQTSAISAGISLASGDVVIPMDSDMENDPRDIGILIDKMNEGYTVVSGWRKNRWNGGFKEFVKRKIPSVFANKLISKITKVDLHDFGCIMKAYRSDILKEVNLYGEMHRFIPAYAAWNGAKIGEIEVSYKPRPHGKSNYGMNRIFKVLLDLVVIIFMNKYMNRPMHFFGGIGFVSFFLGLLAGFASIVLKIFHLRDFVSTPLPILSALFIIVGIQLVAMGVISEILMRTYYESQHKKSYDIAERINI